MLVHLLFALVTIGIGECRLKDRGVYYGRIIGSLQEYAHGIRGTAYAVDESTIFVKGFSYDGTGPDAFFWVGNTPRPSPEGVLLPYPEDYIGRKIHTLNFTRARTELTGHPGQYALKPGQGTVSTRLKLPRPGDNTEQCEFDGLTTRCYSNEGDAKWVKRGMGNIVTMGMGNAERDPPVLRAYNKTDIILRLPQGKKLKDIKWLSVWCRRFTVNFGEVFMPPNLVAPRSRVLPEFKRLAHGLQSGNITILDAKTFYIPNLHYDGAGPDAYFWVGNGSEPSPLGIKVPNEMGSLEPLRGYQGEDIEIVLPGNLTVYDIDWLAVWCVQYKHNFGHVFIPKDIDVPPALGQTKITTTSTSHEDEMTSNCRELLDERMQVEWSIESDWVQITLSAKIREDQYMAFGISGEQGKSTMVGGDVVVAYFNKEKNTFHAVDYYMSATAQCDGQNGVCPDHRIGGRDDVELITGERRHGVTTVIYRRALHTNEPINDRPIPRSGETSVIAAIGPLNSNHEANAHAVNDKTNEDIRIDFGSKHDGQCTNSLFHLPEEEEIKPWPPAFIKDETVFSVRIGPTGGKRGYTPITGQPSWGIAWYINDLLIPELYVVRGETYTFVVEGGNDPTNPARYHPFYITDNSEGGFGQKSDIKQRQQRVFAGVSYDSEGFPYPTASGRYCEWQHKTVDKSETTETFKEYFETLRLDCAQGEPAYLNWTVPLETPDILYYQCYTHNNLGWKIHVSNKTSASKASSLATDITIATFILVAKYILAS